MRFSKLQLLKYGHFDGCDLEFPSGDLDLQVVFGANEAGKSTTLAAVGDLLFGFPGRTSYDFQHDQQLLRVGAVLQADGVELTCRRRKGNKGTLLGGDDEAIDDGRLVSLLGGYTAETFNRMFSLDHHRLRQGGRAIIEAEDDVGQAIFAAGSGLIGIAGILDQLEAESKEIWTKGGRGDRRYHVAQRAFEDARNRQRSAQVRPAAWDDLRKAVEQFETNLEALKKKRSACELERRVHEAELERLRVEILKAGGGPPLEHLLAECDAADAAELGTRSQELEDEIASFSNHVASLTGQLATTSADFQRLDAGPDSALAAADAEIARAEMLDQPEEEMAAIYLDHAIEALHMTAEGDAAGTDCSPSQSVSRLPKAPAPDHGSPAPSPGPQAER